IHQGAATRTEVAPQQPFDVQVGDEITYLYAPPVPVKGDVSEFVFRISQTAGLPQNVLAAGQYACLIEINPGRQARSSQLKRDYYELGGGIFFDKDSGISRKAVIFERPYAQFLL